ncbi:hypothetical protein ACIPJS_06025 [Streptomyces sp. NPDC086783]|uniref:hypothetical protein n=1 Tax=Streptomyces sp. NPDC086783 TaxID=3365758 RepID=UPI0037FFCF18
MAGTLPFRVLDGAIQWDGTAHSGETDNNTVVRACGYVVRAPNVHNPARRAVLVGGWSTYGTIAAPRRRAEHGAGRSVTADIAVLVEADVLPDGHVAPPRLLHKASLHV